MNTKTGEVVYYRPV